ncbi:hypothetical protein MW887_004164 [Aspergillus wentii]|nr:hypothetical protein MW887_004164 [Aspergillus wentii]
MSGKVPHAAFCEEYDEDANEILPDTRLVANIKPQKTTDLRSAAEPLPIDGASDSGYSSRTAATVNSTQSAPSGRKSPVPLKLDTAALKRADLERVRSSRKEQRVKDRTARQVREREEKMQVGSYPSGGHHPSMQRSPSRRGRESSHVRHYPGTCWECEQGLYHTSSTPVEPRAIEYPYYGSQSGPVHDYPPPPPSPRQAPRYPPSVVHDVHVSHSSRPHARANRTNTYHASGNNRPLSYHGMMPGMGGMMYNPSPMSRYEHGPPLSSSAYANQSYGPAPYPPQSPYYAMSDYMPPSEHHQERSASRPREQPRGRRSSVYGPPVVDYDPPTPTYEDGEPLDHVTSRDSRQRMPSNSSYDREEDYYRMPPPPLKQKSTPHIIQKKRPDGPKKSATTNSITSERRQSKSSFDMSEIDAALPDEGYRRSSRETIIPERSRSLRDSRRPAASAYRESSRPSRIAIEGPRRRRQTIYDLEGEEIEEKSREAEEYQASRSAKAVPVPLTADALYKAKTSQRAESDSGSQKSRSNSSRGSDARTQNGSGVGSKPEDDSNIVMTMNGVTMSFTQESVGGKKISVRTGDTGAVELNIEGKKPQKYLTARSDYTGGSARRELEDIRRVRDDRRSERASRRSSRSTYSNRFLE